MTHNTNMRYECDGRTVRAESAMAAAQRFAGMLARREFGRRGDYHHVRADSWSADGLVNRYEAFIGRPVRGANRQFVGRNVWLTVYREAQS